MSLTSTISVNKQPNIQDAFLSAARRAAARVTVFLMNGYQLKGYVAGHDTFSVILMTDGKQQMIFKHAISTFTPEQPVEL